MTSPRQNQKWTATEQTMKNFPEQPDGRNVQRLFNPPLFILEMSGQEGDLYVLGGRKNLTRSGFDAIGNADISRNGDVVFTASGRS